MRATYNLALLFMLAMLSCTTPSIIATQAIQKGDLANNANNYDDAIRHYQEYIKVSPQLGLYRNPKKESEVCRKLAHAYATQGKYRQSVDYLKKSIAIDSADLNNLELIEDYRQLGVVYAYMGDYRVADRYLQHSLTLNEGMEKSLKDVKRSSVADTYMSLAQLNLTLGNFKNAEAYGQKALNIYTKIPGEHVGTIEAQLLLGIIARETSHLTQAEKLITQSRELSKANRLNTSRQLQALGEIFFLKGNPEEAIRFKLQAVDEAERSAIKPQIVIAYMRVGDAYQQLGDQNQANFFYRKAMSVQATMGNDTLGFAPSFNMRLGDVQKAYDYFRESGSTIGLALVSLRLGEQYYQKNNLDSARFMYQQAKTTFETSGSLEGTAKAGIELAKIYTATNEFSLASKYLQEAYSKTIQPDLRWQIYFRKGIVFEGLNAYDSARSNYLRSIEVIDEMRGNISIEEFKTLFANTKVEVYDRLIMLLLKQYKNLTGYTYERAVEESFAYNEQSRSRAFLDMLGNKRIDPKSAADVVALDQEQLLRLKIQKLSKELNSADSAEEQRQLKDELHEAQELYSNLIAKIKLSNPAYSTVVTIKPPSVKQIQQDIPPHTAVLEYWMSDESLVIWMLDKTSVTATVVPYTRMAVQREIKGCRTAISMQLSEQSMKSLKGLYDILIAPVYEKLSKYENIIVVPHRQLHFLPFQSLATAQNKFLVEQFVISYAPSASVLAYCMERDVSKGESFLGMALGDTEIGDYESLPGTKLEVQQVSQLYPGGNIKYGQPFSETFVKANAGNYNYVHFATHGLFNVHQPLYSFLLMNSSGEDDGRLTVDEIFGLQLKSKFVTLSACETGLGDISEGDELVGLSRAFIYAGSPAVVVSLWKVDDATTAWTMTRFHQYVHAGHAAAEALSFAQRDLLQRNFIVSKSRGIKSVELDAQLQKTITTRDVAVARNPYFWSPFILVGNGLVR